MSIGIMCLIIGGFSWIAAGSVFLAFIVGADCRRAEEESGKWEKGNVQIY